MKALLSIILSFISFFALGQFIVPSARMWMYDNCEQLPQYSWGINQQVGYSMATGGTQNPPNQDPSATIEVSSTYKRKGTYSYKAYVSKRPDKYGQGTQWCRSEWMWLSPGQQTTSNEWQWASISILIDPSFQFENRPTQIAYDTKASPDNYETPFWLGIMEGKYYVDGFFINGPIYLGDVTKGVWEDWIVHRNFKNDNTGFLYLYRNGVIVYSLEDKPNYRLDGGDAPIARVQHGLYKWVWSKANGDGWGEGSPLAAANAPMTIYMDEIRFGKSTATLNDMLVDGGTGNSVPVANAGSNVVITQPTSTTSLSGSQSTDTDGTIASYAWTQSASNPSVAGIVSPSSVTTNITGLTTVGTYVFTLTVTDNLGATAQDNVTVTVQSGTAPNSPPSAYAGNNVILTLPDDSYTFSGSGAGAPNATDPDGDVSLLWTLEHGTATLTNSNLLTLTISGMVADYYTLRLTATDAGGLTATDTVNITVLPEPVPPNPPVAVTGVNQTIILPLDSILADGTNSFVIEDSIVAYNWSRVSGPAGFSVRNQGSPLTYIYDLDEGTYVIRLITIAGNTKEDTAQFTVVVQPVPLSNNPPEIDSMTAVTINLPTVTTPGATTLAVSATDPDGSITQYSWVQVSGPTSAIFGTPASATTSIYDLVTGTYVFAVTVYDDKQLSSTATVTVNVLQPLRQGSFFLRFRKRTI